MHGFWMPPDFIIAFMMVFAPGNVGEGKTIDVYQMSLKVCLMEYPDGMVVPHPPIQITMSRGTFTAPFVLMCLRPKTDADRKEQEQEEEGMKQKLIPQPEQKTRLKVVASI